jgi:NAD(P)-dependent dehydrogenase (short-subunit alcohol dehydrogenase family)
MVKTLSHEWPETRCKVVDFESGIPPLLAAERLFAELAADPHGSPIEIGYRGARRVEVRVTPASVSTGVLTRESKIFSGSPVILITGGARGIRAKAALTILSRHKANLVLVGRSPLPPEHEPSETLEINSARQLRAILINQARRTGCDPEPAAVEASYFQLLRDREIRTNLQAMRETGSAVQYLQCDLADADGFSLIIDEIYLRYGRIDGVIHGAGVIEDRLVENKDAASFERVIAAKVTGALVLAKKLRVEFLRFLVLFSSVSGRFGNRGQIDYAAANEILNKLAAYLDARWRCRVVAINWGPWDGSNMVGAAVRQQFFQRGVQLIEPEIGCDALLSELSAGSKGNPEVILGGGPWGAAKSSVPVGERAAPANPILALLDTDPPMVGPGPGIQFQLLLDPARHPLLSG